MTEVFTDTGPVLHLNEINKLLVLELFEQIKLPWLIMALKRQCDECHTIDGILDFELLGYSPERFFELEHLPEVGTIG
jgi:hypothetical protein